MRNIIIFLFTVLAVSAAIFGIFHFIFPQTSAMMGWCVASGILVTVAMAANIILVSSHSTITPKNTATSWCINITGICLFVWTLFFVFVLGDYDMEERSLNGLYVGYLIIIIVGLAITFMADRGGYLAQAHNTEIQDMVSGREGYIAQLNQLKLNAIESMNLNPRGDNASAFSKNIDLLRNVPASKFASPIVGNQLSNAIMSIDEAIEAHDNEKIKLANHNLSLILKSIRI